MQENSSDQSASVIRGKALLRLIPQVDALLASEAFAELASEFDRETLVRTTQSILDDFRQAVLSSNDDESSQLADEGATGTAGEGICPPGGWWPGRGQSKTAADLTDEALAAAVRDSLKEDELHQLRPLLNATGISLHTNLGRAPLARAAAESMARLSLGYTNLEYDLAAGHRGSRHDVVEGLLTRLTGTEAAMVVNNNAGAMLILLAELAQGREVIVSRGELVEIGGAFRVPDVMVQSGATLVEVGTTNKTRLSDYARAINENTAAILKVHRSNFRLEGFTEEASLEECKSLAEAQGLPLIYDLGSGLLHPDPPAFLKDEPTVAEGVAAGCDLVCFSGDKLLGGPQAGLIVGRKDLIERIKKHPLARALRCDKICLIALQETLRIYLEPERINEEIPLFRMLSQPLSAIEKRADVLCDLLDREGFAAEVCQLKTEVGGGSAPGIFLDSAGIRLSPQENGFRLNEFERALRCGEPGIIAFIQKDSLVLDLRTIPDEEVETLAACFTHARDVIGERAE